MGKTTKHTVQTNLHLPAISESEVAYLEVQGARVHNLQNLDVAIPRNSLVVITGVSGSGKSSLAFDTIYAEGQRRYMESFSSYARQFFGGIERPDVSTILPDYFMADPNAAADRNITINIEGGLSTSAEIGEAVVNAIRSFNTVHGPANIAVAV